MGTLFEYIKPIIYFLILESLILSIISDKDFQKLTKMFCGIVLAILILLPIKNIMEKGVDTSFDLEDAQWKNTLKQYENLARNGDEFLKTTTRLEYEQLVKDKVSMLAENQGLHIISCEIAFLEEEICTIQEISVKIQENAKQMEEAQSIKLKNDIAEMIGLQTNQIDIMAKG